MTAKTQPRPASEGETRADEHVVVFRLGDEHYATDIGLVQEIVRMQPITHIPESDHRVEGVTTFRGQVVPVIDLRRACGVAAGEPTVDSRIVVITTEDERTFGLVVDAVSEVLRIPAAEIESANRVIGQSRMLNGIAKVGGRLIALLNLDSVLPDSAHHVPEVLEAIAA